MGSGEGNKKSNKGIWLILTMISALITAVCIGWIVIYLIQTYDAQKRLDELQENYIKETEAEDVIFIQSEEPVEEYDEDTSTKKAFGDEEIEQSKDVNPLSKYDILQKDIDWDLLAEENADIYAWITVPGTVIDYPVLQHPEQLDYYLNHNLDKSSGYPGCIYTQMLNSKEWDDPQTVLYGHNMKNGTMFAGLHNYEDSVFFEENPYVYIYTENYVRVYQIFASYEFASAHLLLSFDTKNPETFGAYLEGVFQRDGLKDNFNREIEVTAEDKIITLSTCISNKPDNRYLVQAVLVAEGTTE